MPCSLLDGFLSRIAEWLRPSGHVFFVDARRERSSAAVDHHLPPPGEEVMLRRLDDGREFRVVKNFWDADDLTARFRRAGLSVHISETATFFQYGTGVRA